MKRALVLLSILVLTCPVRGAVRLERIPNQGIQPQVAVDSAGTAHLLYFKGDPKAGDIYYTRREPGKAEWKYPIRVNGEGKVMAVGNVRGAHLALGREGRAHAAWMGAAQINAGSGKEHPMLYTRMNHSRDGFEPERNVITHAYGLDGGGSVAADAEGNVYVAWHGNPPANKEGEEGRAVYLARSADEGKTFQREVAVSSPEDGACACCGMKIFAGPGKALSILYRNADTREARAAALLLSKDGGQTFNVAHTDVWRINTCPMSTAYLGAFGEALVAGWETQGTVCFAAFDPHTGHKLKEYTPKGQRKARFPAAARNERGEAVVIWTENMAWMKGGNVAWQTLAADGEPTGERGNIPGVPVWSFAAVYAEKGGEFILLY